MASHITGTAEWALPRTPPAARRPVGFKDRLLPGAIPIVARPGGRRKGEDLVVIRESDIIGNIAS
jgi:hypothetical protein